MLFMSRNNDRRKSAGRQFNFLSFMAFLADGLRLFRAIRMAGCASGVSNFELNQLGARRQDIDFIARHLRRRSLF